MGLYDSYQLANSSGIKTYQGSVVPELVQVSQQLQDRYDKTLDNMDDMTRFFGNMQAHAKDQPALQEMAQNYKDKIAAIAGKKDLENSLRETTMLANNVTSDYAPFAQVLKEQQEYHDKINKDVDAGLITPETGAAKIAQSEQYYQGIQKDPFTGKYRGRYNGQTYVKDINTDKKVDEWLDKALPSTQGYSHEQAGDKWIIKQNDKVIDMPASTIQEIIRQGANNDSEYQAWARQKADLATYNQDYSKIHPEDLGIAPGELGLRKDPNDRTGKKGIPVTVQDQLRAMMDRGYSLPEALRSLHQYKIGNSLLQNMQNYGVAKYKRHDVEHSDGIQANPYGVEDYKNSSIPIQATILQPTSGSQYKTLGDLSSAIDTHDNANVEQYKQYLAWSNKNGVKANGSPYDPNTRWFDAQGNEKTSEARKMIDAQQQANVAAQQLRDKRTEAMKRAGFKDGEFSQELVKKAEAARKEAEADAQHAGLRSGGASEDEIKRAGQKAYNSVVSSDPRYKKMDDYLAQDAQNNSVPIGITTFKNTKINTAVENAFNNLSTNLDAAGLKYGAQGLQWASGDKAGTDLSSDDYQKVIGQGKFAGVGIDADGQYKMFFKVGTSKTNAKGEQVGQDILVKMPAYSGITSNLVKEGQITPAQQYLAQSIGSGIDKSPSKSIEVPLGKDLKVSVREVKPSDKSSYSNAAQANYIITYYGNEGRTKDVVVPSLDGAVNSIIESLQKH